MLAVTSGINQGQQDTCQNSRWWLSEFKSKG